MDGDVVTPGGLVVPSAALTWRFSRGTGPGGQSVNTTDSRVELVVDISVLTVSETVAVALRAAFGDSLRIVVGTERSQLRNREIAMRRLSAKLDAAARPIRPRRATKPTAGSVRRRLETKQLRSDLKATRRDLGQDPS